MSIEERLKPILRNGLDTPSLQVQVLYTGSQVNYVVPHHMPSIDVKLTKRLCLPTLIIILLGLKE